MRLALRLERDDRPGHLGQVIRRLVDEQRAVLLEIHRERSYWDLASAFPTTSSTWSGLNGLTR